MHEKNLIIIAYIYNFRKRKIKKKISILKILCTYNYDL